LIWGGNRDHERKERARRTQGLKKKRYAGKKEKCKTKGADHKENWLLGQTFPTAHEKASADPKRWK